MTTSSPFSHAYVSRVLRYPLTLLLVLSCTSAFGAPGIDAAPAADGAIATTNSTTNDLIEENVRFFNREVMTMRAEFLGRSPQLRAATAEANIRRIVEKPGIPKIEFKETQQGSVMLLGGELVTIITPADLDILHGQTMARARNEISQRLGEAISVAERDQAPRRFLQGVLWALTASVVVASLMLAALWLARRMRQRFADWVDQRNAGLQLESARQLALNLRSTGDWVLRVITVLLLLFLAEEWLRFVLNQFGFTQPWAESMTDWMLQQAIDLGNGIAQAFPGIVVTIAIFLLARVLTRTISMTLRSVQSGRFQLFGIDGELAEPTRKLIVVAIWLFALAMAYPYLPGAHTEAFKGLSVLVGLMVSLGASGIVGQAAAGFTILYSRTMSIGDLVRSGEVEGIVTQIGLFTTRIRTFTGVEVSIPNTVVLGGQLHNYSRHPDGPGMWLETGVTIGYDAPWRQVHRLLLDAAAKTSRIQTTPAPYVLQTALSDFYVEYRLRARISDVKGRALVLSDLHAQIQDAFNAAGVQIMSPNYEADPEHPKLVAPAHWEGRTEM